MKNAEFFRRKKEKRRKMLSFFRNIRYYVRGMIYRWPEGGKIINYEIRYMLILLMAVINQKPLQMSKRHIGWEIISKASDFHNVINIIYLGMLGIEKDISEDCRLQFYQSYKKELLLRKSYKDAEEVIMWQLERHGIDALLLNDTRTEELYVKPEMAYIAQIEILVNKKSLAHIHRFMRNMDYEQEEDRLGNGTVYTRVPGIRIVFYDQVPIENKVVKRQFSEPIRKYLHMKNYRHIHILSREEMYMYRTGRLVEAYVSGTLRIRDVLDFWQYQKLLEENFHWKTVNEILENAKWTEFIKQVGVLGALWFGEGIRQEYGLALELEEYILSGGKENSHLDKALLPNEQARLDFYWRSREKEWTMRKREWLFPKKEYMSQLFPILGKLPFLLVFCWLIRDFRFLRIVCANRCKQAWIRIQVRILDIKEKIKVLTRRGEEEMSGEQGEISQETKRKEVESTIK